jgi:hypothetical protein
MPQHVCAMLSLPFSHEDSFLLQRARSILLRARHHCAEPHFPVHPPPYALIFWQALSPASVRIHQNAVLHTIERTKTTHQNKLLVIGYKRCTNSHICYGPLNNMFTSPKTRNYRNCGISQARGPTEPVKGLSLFA